MTFHKPILRRLSCQSTLRNQTYLWALWFLFQRHLWHPQLSQPCGSPFPSYTQHCSSLLLGEEDRNWFREGKGRTSSRSHGEHCLWLTLWLSPLTFLESPGPSTNGWCHPQWTGPSTSIINQDSLSQTCSQVNLIEAFHWHLSPVDYMRHHKGNKTQLRLNCLWESDQGSPLIKANYPGAGKRKKIGGGEIKKKLAENALELVLCSPPHILNGKQAMTFCIYSVSWGCCIPNRKHHHFTCPVQDLGSDL